MARNLKSGSRGEDVRQLQSSLNRSPPTSLPLLTVDGAFGGNTTARVREFQRNNNLAVDGVVGPNTRARLGALTTGSPASRLRPDDPFVPTEVVDITPVRRPSAAQVDAAVNTLASYGRWRTPPQPSAGMGGIFPMEDPRGRVNYDYLNWLLAYSVTIEALMAGDSPTTARRAWSDYKQRNGMLAGAPGQGGADKAEHVWLRIISLEMREMIVDNYKGIVGRPREISGRVLDRIRAHNRSEARRLNAPGNYPGWFLWVPTR